MSDCVLPVTGSNPLFLVLFALLALGTGLALVLGVRRRGIVGGAAVLVAVLLGAATLVVTDNRRADAQECVPATTVPPTATPTTIAATTTAAATTIVSTTTTTTAATTTTVGGAVPTNPTFPTTPTSSTTTTVAAPDLTPDITGPTNVELFNPLENPPQFTIVIANEGTAPTTGQLTFTVELDADFTLDLVGQSGPPWLVTQSGDVLTFTSNVVIAPGTSSSVTFELELLTEDTGQLELSTTLPDAIGGEPATANTNNSDSHTVTIDPPQQVPV